jgi:hypothetical protein
VRGKLKSKAVTEPAPPAIGGIEATRPVPDHARVVFLLDLGFGIDQHATGHMPVDLQLEDVGGVRGSLIGRIGELDAPGFYQRRVAPNSSCAYPATETGDMKSW